MGTDSLTDQFISKLQEDAEYCLVADDVGSIHRCMAQWQEWIKTWPQIADEDGGI